MEYPRVKKLIDAVNDYNIIFEVLPDEQRLQDLFYRKITITISGETFTIPVMDDYEDVDDANPVVLLQIVLQECRFYSEADDFLIWTQDMGLNASSAVARHVHLDLGKVVPLIQEKLPDIKPIPAYDMEFNTGMARALRDSKL